MGYPPFMETPIHTNKRRRSYRNFPGVRSPRDGQQNLQPTLQDQSGSGELENPPGSKPELIYDCLVDQYQVGLPEGIHHFKLENPTIQFPGKETLAGQSAQLGEYPKNDPPIRVFSPRDPMPGGCPFAPCATAGPGCAYICNMCIHVWMDG